MNRKQRRALLGSKGNLTLSEKQARLKQHEDQMKDKLVGFATEAFMSLFALALCDELGFGKKRIEKILTRVEHDYSCIISGHLTLEDVKTEIYDRFQIIISAEKGGSVDENSRVL